MTDDQFKLVSFLAITSLYEETLKSLTGIHSLPFEKFTPAPKASPVPYAPYKPSMGESAGYKNAKHNTRDTAAPMPASRFNN